MGPSEKSLATSGQGWNSYLLKTNKQKNKQTNQTQQQQTPKKTQTNKNPCISVYSTDETKLGIVSVFLTSMLSEVFGKSQQRCKEESSKPSGQRGSDSLEEGWEFNLSSSSEKWLRNDLIDSSFLHSKGEKYWAYKSSFNLMEEKDSKYQRLDGEIRPV